jgi:hypothetical protein
MQYKCKQVFFIKKKATMKKASYFELLFKKNLFFDEKIKIQQLSTMHQIIDDRMRDIKESSKNIA